MFNLAILQARMGSKRLPNKVLREVNGKPLLEYEYSRIMDSQQINKIIIATSTLDNDNPIEGFAKKRRIEIFRGSPENVLDRYYECAKHFRENNSVEELNIVRITGDCPLIDPVVIDEIITSYLRMGVDYASNTLTPTYPDGMDIEIFSFDALRNAHKLAKYPSDKEHVTLFIKNSDMFTKYNHEAESDFSHFRLTVDEENDFKLIKAILEYYGPRGEKYTYLDIISMMTKNPDLLTINSTISRDEGLQKSLKMDGRI